MSHIKTPIYLMEPAAGQAFAIARNRQLYEWWLERRGRRAMPTRADFDPAQMRGMLGYFSFLEVLPGGRFRFRVDGTEVVAATGVDMTGRMADSYPHTERRDAILASYVRTVAERQAMRIYMDVELDRRWFNLEIILLPLGDESNGVTHLISGMGSSPELPRSWP
jgi:hypothetical protein